MKRILLAVGCDKYDSLNALKGAVADAKNIFSALTDDVFGNYATDGSVLLLSPTLETLKAALKDVLFGVEEIDTFTFFFAGHGGTKAGSYYLCLRDSDYRMLSATALGIAEIFALINEAQPRQSNIILDACQAGGVVADLNALLKPELIGGADTPGITIFASSAADEYSGDTEKGGVGTIALLKAIRGDIVVQTNRPTLDLLEVGKVAASQIQSEDLHQTPVLWGLNLYGEARFCKNSHYTGDSFGVIPPLLHFSRGSPYYNAVKAASDLIWREYFAADEDFDVSRFLSRVLPVIEVISEEPANAADFVRGLYETFSSRAGKSNDIFRLPELTATCAVALLPQAGTNADVDRVITELTARLASEVNAAIAETMGLVKENKYCILTGGFSDLFYLPIRLSRLAGWAGTLYFLNKWNGTPTVFPDALVKEMAQYLGDNYVGSLTSISDSQAPFLLPFLICCHEQGWEELGELYSGLMFNTFVSARGLIASPRIKAERTFEYLQRRIVGNFRDGFDLLAHPGEMLSLLLMAARLFKNEDAYDSVLHEIDHLPFNVFIPADHRSFGQNNIREGINYTFQIGRGIWRVEDFIVQWEKNCLGQIVADNFLKTVTGKSTALLASLLRPDRTPWFVAADVWLKSP